MAGEEPPYLTVGTDVSAKYKGAFCEAKVKKVIRCVKCKVTYKNNLGTVTVTDDHVKGTLRVGAQTEVKHPEKNQYFEAVINKLHDQSQYTVVFDDGDETTLRRTSLCLKSGRHFAESETLDQLPLTHPEHFGSPVMGCKGRKRRSLNRSLQDDGSSDEEAPRKKKESKPREPDPDISKVVCVELGDKKKMKDNWFPALVVALGAQDAIKINPKEEYLVRSFKDGKYHCVLKRDTRPFTREIGSKVDNNTLKTAVEKASQYTDRDELPPHWDRDILFGSSSADNVDSNEDSDSDTSDDEPSEEKDRFVAQLYKFMDDRGTPINKAPTVSNKDLNLCRLFKLVQKLGGYNRVTNHMQWKAVYAKMGLPGYNTSSSHQIKQAYKKYLHSFEDFYRKLGCTMGTSTRSGRMRHRSGRSSFILMRDRDREFKAAGRRMAKQENKKKDEKSKKEEDTSKISEGKDEIKTKDNEKKNESVNVVTDNEQEPQEPVKPKEEKKTKIKKEKHIEKKIKAEKEEKLKTKGRKKHVKEEAGRESKAQESTDEGEVLTDIDIHTGDKVRVKYGRGRHQKIYEAKVLEVEEEGCEKHFYVHYTGWNMRYDEWVKRHRIVENLSQKARKGRSAGSPKISLFMCLQGSGTKQPAAKRGRPPTLLAKSSLSGRKQSVSVSPRSRSTRSDKNSLAESPFVNGLEPRKRPRKSSGQGDRSNGCAKESDDSDDESDDEPPQHHPFEIKKEQTSGKSLVDHKNEFQREFPKIDTPPEKSGIENQEGSSVNSNKKMKKMKKSLSEELSVEGEDHVDTDDEEEEEEIPCQTSPEKRKAKGDDQVKKNRKKFKPEQENVSENFKPKKKGKKRRDSEIDNDEILELQAMDLKPKITFDAVATTENLPKCSMPVLKNQESVGEVQEQDGGDDVQVKKKLKKDKKDENAYLESSVEDNESSPPISEMVVKNQNEEKELNVVEEHYHVENLKGELNANAKTEFVSTDKEVPEEVCVEQTDVIVLGTAEKLNWKKEVIESGDNVSRELESNKPSFVSLPCLISSEDHEYVSTVHSEIKVEVVEADLPSDDAAAQIEKLPDLDLFKENETTDLVICEDVMEREQTTVILKTTQEIHSEDESTGKLKLGKRKGRVKNDNEDDSTELSDMEGENKRTKSSLKKTLKSKRTSQPSFVEEVNVIDNDGNQLYTQPCTHVENQDSMLESNKGAAFSLNENLLKEDLKPVTNAEKENVNSAENSKPVLVQLSSAPVCDLVTMPATENESLDESINTDVHENIIDVQICPYSEESLDKDSLESEPQNDKILDGKSSRKDTPRKEEATDMEVSIVKAEEVKKKLKDDKKVKDEERKPKEKQKKSKEKKSKYKKDDLLFKNEKEQSKIFEKRDMEKLKKKENKKKKEAERKKTERIESDAESIDSSEIIRKKERKKKNKQDDRKKDGDSVKKKSKKKSLKDHKFLDDKLSDEEVKDVKDNKRSGKKGDKLGKTKKKKDKNKKDSSSDDHEGMRVKLERDHLKKNDKRSKQETSKQIIDKFTFNVKQENELDEVTNLLICREDVPMSPVAGEGQSSKSDTCHHSGFIQDNQFEVPVSPVKLVSSTLNMTSNFNHLNLGICEGESSYNSLFKHDQESSTVLDNTPPTTPDSAVSTISSSAHECDISPRRDEEHIKTGQGPMDYLDLENYNEVSKLVCHEHVDFAQSEAAMVLGSLGVQGYDSRLAVAACPSPATKRAHCDFDDSTPKKKKKSRRRLHSSSDMGKNGSNSPGHDQSCCAMNKAAASDSDDPALSVHPNSSSFQMHHHPSSSNSSSCSTSSYGGVAERAGLIMASASRSLRPSKFNFFVDLDDYMDGSERIAVLQEKLAALKKTYMSLKAEVACIDRRRKKLRKKEKEATSIGPSALEVVCS